MEVEQSEPLETVAHGPVIYDFCRDTTVPFITGEVECLYGITSSKKSFNSLQLLMKRLLLYR